MMAHVIRQVSQHAGDRRALPPTPRAGVASPLQSLYGSVTQACTVVSGLPCMTCSVPYAPFFPRAQAVSPMELPPVRAQTTAHS